MLDYYLVRANVSDIDRKDLDYSSLINGALSRDVNIFVKLINFFNLDANHLNYIHKNYDFKDLN